MSSILNHKNNLVYNSFALAKKEIGTIEPIDYFFAKELISIFRNVDSANNDQIFHLLMALSESLRVGHTCLPVDIIANSHFGYESDDFGVVQHHGFVFADEQTLEGLLSEIDLTFTGSHPIVYSNKKLYMRRYFSFEQDLFSAINSKSQPQDQTQERVLEESSPFDFSEDHIKQCLAEFFPTQNHVDNIDLNEIDWQKVAVANALNKKFSVIAGGPGTGKTYTVTKLLAAIIYLFNLSNLIKPSDSGNKPQVSLLKMALVAPTGKAAQRLQESLINSIHGFKGIIDDEILNGLPTDTQTIHRLLGVIPNSPNFRYNEQNLLNIDVLLIDEVSMVDLAMMTRVFRAIPSHCNVILLGDADQLPSVAAGSVLNDIAPRPFNGYSKPNATYLQNVTGSRVPQITKKQTDQFGLCDYVTFLTKSRRFDSDGGIGLIAKAVIAGNYEQSWSILNQSNGENQVYHLQHDTIDWLRPLVEQYYLPIYSCKSVDEAFDCLSQFRVLCATKVGEQGVDRINELVCEILKEKNIIRHDELYYQGRPIMVTENHYSQGLYNGDIGFLWKNKTGHLMAVFEDVNNQFKWIMTSKLPKIETVFAMTIHKTQGSEFKHVAMLLPNQKDNRLLSRELLYTGITRAKETISIATHSRVWRQGVETQINRHSGYSRI